jgi:hypothetical protein
MYETEQENLSSKIFYIHGRGTQFETRPRHQLSCLENFRNFLYLSKKLPKSYLKLDQVASFHILCSLLFSHPIIRPHKTWLTGSVFL